MDCYDAFNDIVDEFKDLLRERETSVRKMEKQFAHDLHEESSVVKRLEHQVENLRLVEKLKICWLFAGKNRNLFLVAKFFEFPDSLHGYQGG